MIYITLRSLLLVQVNDYQVTFTWTKMNYERLDPPRRYVGIPSTGSSPNLTKTHFVSLSRVKDPSNDASPLTRKRRTSTHPTWSKISWSDIKRREKQSPASPMLEALTDSRAKFLDLIANQRIMSWPTKSLSVTAEHPDTFSSETR